jgi:hypothetical protein
MPCEALSIYITDDMFSKLNFPRLIINLHTSIKEIISSDNEILKTFFIIGIRNDQKYDFLKFRALLHKSYNDNKGIVGGIFKDSPYVFKDGTSIDNNYCIYQKLKSIFDY